jgi:hypothetical protein
MSEAARDSNRVTTLLGVSSVDGQSPVTLYANPSTHSLEVNASIDTTGLATSDKQDTGNTSLGNINTKLPSLGQALAASSVPVVLPATQISTLTPPTAMLPYPVGATPITSSSGNQAAGAAIATLAKAANKTTYITGFEITSSGATVGLVVNPTVVGVVTGTLTYTYAASAGVLLINTPLIVSFSIPIPSSAVNTDIVVTLPSLGLGNTNACVVAHGYLL